MIFRTVVAFKQHIHFGLLFIGHDFYSSRVNSVRMVRIQQNCKEDHLALLICSWYFLRASSISSLVIIPRLIHARTVTGDNPAYLAAFVLIFVAAICAR